MLIKDQSRACESCLQHAVGQAHPQEELDPQHMFGNRRILDPANQLDNRILRESELVVLASLVHALAGSTVDNNPALPQQFDVGRGALTCMYSARRSVE